MRREGLPPTQAILWLTKPSAIFKQLSKPAPCVITVLICATTFNKDSESAACFLGKAVCPAPWILVPQVGLCNSSRCFRSSGRHGLSHKQADAEGSTCSHSVLHQGCWNSNQFLLWAAEHS